MEHQMPMCSCGASRVKTVWPVMGQYDQLCGLSYPVTLFHQGTCGNGCEPVTVPESLFPLPAGVQMLNSRPFAPRSEHLPVEFSGDDPSFYDWIW